MPSTPSRRAALRTAALAFAAGSGCLGLSGSDGPASATDASPTTLPATPPGDGTYTDAPSGPEQYPERPDDATPGTVRSYARAFEHAAVTNAMHDFGYGGVEEVSLECDAVHHAAADGGHYALAACVGYANYADGVHADWGPRPALYYVADGLTVRVKDVDRKGRVAMRRAGDPDATDTPTGSAGRSGEEASGAFRVYNLDTEARSVATSVDYVEGGASREVFAAEYDLDPVSGVHQTDVTFDAGAHRLTAMVDGESAGGRTATGEWVVDDGSGFEESRLSVVVAPTGAVSVRRFPFEKL